MRFISGKVNTGPARETRPGVVAGAVGGRGPVPPCSVRDIDGARIRGNRRDGRTPREGWNGGTRAGLEDGAPRSFRDNSVPIARAALAARDIPWFGDVAPARARPRADHVPRAA